MYWMLTFLTRYFIKEHSGVVAQEGVNVHEYESAECKIMHKTIGQPTFMLSVSRKDKARTVGEMLAVKVAPD